MNTSFFGELLQSIAERGRALIDRRRNRYDDAAQRSETLIELCEELVSGRGEASGVALAREILGRYDELTTGPRIAFFEALATRFGPDRASIETAVAAWKAAPSDAAAAELHTASEPRRQELLRRLNLAPNGTAALVAMREQLLDALEHRDDLAALDADFVHLFTSWFNRGFLVLRHIDWSTPAVILEKIIRYEAVHEIRDWDDLRRRIDPSDRRCYAFFHPALVDEPLIFVEVALTREVPGAIAPDSGRARPGRSGHGNHGRVLFDLQLPARARRRQLRPFPDQAGCRRDFARNSPAVDLRHLVAGAAVRQLAGTRAVDRKFDVVTRGRSCVAGGA